MIAALGAILVWAGLAVGLRAAYLLFRALVEPDRAPYLRPAGWTAALAGGLLLVGSRLAPGPAWSIPLVWFILPFSAWLGIVALIFVGLRMFQAISAIERSERRDRGRAAGLWALVLVGAAAGSWFDPDFSASAVDGAISLSAIEGLALLFFALAAVATMGLTARSARFRAVAKGTVTHATLIAGSLLFGLPLIWLLITSFKEDVDMASPHGIVWVPRVQVTQPYRDPRRPLYQAEVNGTTIQGDILERRAGGEVRLDVNKPMSMRGSTVDVPASALREVDREAPVVTATVDGQPIRGLVVEQLEDGRERVRAISPPSLAGRVHTLLPSEVTPVRKIGFRWRNYPDALDFLPPEANRGLAYLKNTILIAVLGVVGAILSSALVAYGFSRLRFPGRDVLFGIMLATMMLPGAVTKLPQFMIFRQLGWIDTLYPLWVPAFFGSAFSIFLLRQFYKQVPIELEDAAKIDGAGYLRTFWSVMTPQIMPALAVIAILTFVGAWNNFLDPLIYISSPDKMTISYAVQLFASDRATEPGLVTAFTALAMLPVLALFFFTQRYFIEGAQLSGLGGR